MKRFLISIRPKMFTSGTKAIDLIESQAVRIVEREEGRPRAVGAVDSYPRGRDTVSRKGLNYVD